MKTRKSFILFAFIGIFVFFCLLFGLYRTKITILRKALHHFSPMMIVELMFSTKFLAWRGQLRCYLTNQLRLASHAHFASCWFYGVCRKFTGLFSDFSSVTDQEVTDGNNRVVIVGGPQSCFLGPAGRFSVGAKRGGRLEANKLVVSFFARLSLRLKACSYDHQTAMFFKKCCLPRLIR